MGDIEYVFGTGDGIVHIWTSQADLELAKTGTADAVRLDFDGDGLFDDALWDSHGSGIADVSALDLDDDGVLDHFFTDPTGQGVWDHQITGNAADASDEPLDWIVRTCTDVDAEEPDRLTDTAPSPEATVAPHYSPWLDDRAPLEQLGALHDHRTAPFEATPQDLGFDELDGPGSDGELFRP